MSVLLAHTVAIITVITISDHIPVHVELVTGYWVMIEVVKVIFCAVCCIIIRTSSISLYCIPEH